MIADDPDTQMRTAAFEHVRRLGVKPGFVFDGERLPLINPKRGIFKPPLWRGHRTLARFEGLVSGPVRSTPPT